MPSRSPLLLALLLAAATVHAQAPAEGADDPRRNQRVQRIQHEDAGSRIDEVRYGGQTQSITVQPKGTALPGYEVDPANFSRTRPGDNREGLSSAGGQRSWNLLRF